MNTTASFFGIAGLNPAEGFANFTLNNNETDVVDMSSFSDVLLRPPLSFARRGWTWPVVLFSCLRTIFLDFCPLLLSLFRVLVVSFRMFSHRCYAKILKPIIEFVAVNVVDNFPSMKATTKSFFNKLPVLKLSFESFISFGRYIHMHNGIMHINWCQP